MNYLLTITLNQLNRNNNNKIAKDTNELKLITIIIIKIVYNILSKNNKLYQN